ncbi:hypothetical protein SLEP1_g31515 [Rubroshorea leprosula]|uniref:Uncharacterized protein n=1 Tax=Rubroshorea leprosula TaxID=152421 RepID=A0AAV5K9D5_9ROSI|nr:hypothetical protein SLEP1_g31515 [Rubroshorea leprosula]
MVGFEKRKEDFAEGLELEKKPDEVEFIFMWRPLR